MNFFTKHLFIILRLWRVGCKILWKQELSSLYMYSFLQWVVISNILQCIWCPECLKINGIFTLPSSTFKRKGGGGWLRRKPGYRSLDLNVGTICKFRILRRPRVSACSRAKARLMRVKTAAELPENEENLKGLMFQWAPNLLIGLRNHSYVQQKEDQLFVTEKNNERNQKLSGGVGWWASSIKMRRWSQNPQNMVKPWSHFNVHFQWSL